jgi:heptose-I-phosphate ethanolaminephosphotransferase
MLFQPKILKLAALVVWGCLIFLIIGNQHINLDYLQEVKKIPLENGQYQFSERGNDTETVSKHRIDRGRGQVLFGYSDKEIFLNLLTFNFQKPRQIRFESRFSKTRSCREGVRLGKADLYLNVNGNEYILQSHDDKRGVLTRKLSADDQITLHAQTSYSACGAVLLDMFEERKPGGFAHYLLLNILWIIFIILMLVSGKILLPLLSALIFYIFQKAELLYSPFLFWEQLFVFSSLAIAVSLLLSVILPFYKNRLLVRSLVSGFSFLFILLTCLLPLLALGFEEMFGGHMSKQDWFAILQTNSTEAFEFITVFATGDLLIKLTTLGFFLLLFLFFSGKGQAKYRFIHWLGILFFCFIVAGNYMESNLISKSLAAISEYNEDLRRLEEQTKAREKQAYKIQAEKQRTDEIYIVIIGESANRNHLSLYGYPRSTNPRLLKRYQNNDLTRFAQAYSCDVSTLGSLQYAFTSATLEKGAPSTSPTIMEVLNRADFYTYWLHNGSTSVKRNLVSLIGEQAKYTDHLSSIYGKEDSKLLAEVDKVLKKNDSKSKVVFVKTQGSHIAYCNRLPNSEDWVFEDTAFTKWMVPDKYEVTRISAAGKKCYDGTIKYTDYFIDEIINRVKQTGKTAAVIYFSDHGEEIVEGTAHMGSKPTYGVFSIPMFLWFSEGYQKRYPIRYKNTAANAEKIFINDALFDSLLGLMAVDYNDIQPENDISSDLFTGGKLIYRGRKTVYDSDNYIFNTPRNIDRLRKESHPYSVYVGPLEHPFHLTWVTGENRYERLALAGIYQDGVFKLDSPLYRKFPVVLTTILKYIQPHPEQKFFLRLKVNAGDNDKITAIVNSFLELVETNEIKREDLIVASSNHVFLDALIALNIEVSYLITAEKSYTNFQQYKAVTVNHDQLAYSLEYIGDKPVDVWISSCDINSCNQQFFKNLDKRAKKINIGHVILPMFGL